MGRLVTYVVVGAAFVAAALVSSASPILAQSPSAADAAPAPWRHPVDAPIVDYFRAPAGPYSAGNRGLEYDTRTGQAVVAVADGVVTFAGTVGVQRFVVVAHTPTLRSTYAYLDGIDVSAGDAVVGGQRVATAARRFHLTARVRDVYVDPLRYLTSSWAVRLVAVRSGRLLVG